MDMYKTDFEIYQCKIISKTINIKKKVFENVKTNLNKNKKSI